MNEEKQKQLLRKCLNLILSNQYEEGKKYANKLLCKKGKQNALAMYILGRIAKEEKDLPTAIYYLEQAVKYLKSKYNASDEYIGERIYASIARISFDIGNLQDAAEYYYQYYLCCKNKQLGLEAYSARFMSLVCTNIAPDNFLDELNTYSVVTKKLLGKLPIPEKNDSLKAKTHKIHVAYISPDFRNHVMYAFYYNLMAYYDKNAFYISCINLKKNNDKYTEHIRNLVDNWYEVENPSWNDLAGKLKSMNIDILVDLAGHSANSGLPVLGYRIAPLQISGLGWMESTGFNAVDYLITDKYLDPYDTHKICEKPLYLKSQFCYHAKDGLPVSTGAPCLKKCYITFGIFARICKITDDMLNIWKEIMDKVPNSIFIIKCKMLNNQSAQTLFAKRLVSMGIKLGRIVLEKATVNYMERYLDVDIALDTYPYTGGGTTFDALYMGVPVISLYGERRSSRFGLSILSNAGVGELAVPTPKEYVERAVALASDWDLLDVLHKNLRTMLENSPAMDAEGYVREIEGKYKEILSAVHNHDVFD